MADLKRTNAEYADKLKSILTLRYDPVAVRLIRKGEEIPANPSRLEGQRSHCQLIADARNGSCFLALTENMSCNVGASTLGMVKTPDKVADGGFHFNTGLHMTQDASRRMIDTRTDLETGSVIGEIVCPLREADFEPDVVVFADIPERIYWLSALETAEKGGRTTYVTAPFQCMCEDTVAVPIAKDAPNISIGCFGTRKRTSIRPDEMVIGLPYNRIAPAMAVLDKWKDGILTKAKRD